LLLRYRDEQLIGVTILDASTRSARSWSREQTGSAQDGGAVSKRNVHSEIR
jgi:hypothetical protein